MKEVNVVNIYDDTDEEDNTMNDHGYMGLGLFSMIPPIIYKTTIIVTMPASSMTVHTHEYTGCALYRARNMASRIQRPNINSPSIPTKYCRKFLAIEMKADAARTTSSMAIASCRSFSRALPVYGTQSIRQAEMALAYNNEALVRSRTCR
jgi:hypothetical protein